MSDLVLSDRSRRWLYDCWISKDDPLPDFSLVDHVVRAYYIERCVNGRHGFAAYIILDCGQRDTYIPRQLGFIKGYKSRNCSHSESDQEWIDCVRDAEDTVGELQIYPPPPPPSTRNVTIRGVKYSRKI